MQDRKSKNIRNRSPLPPRKIWWGMGEFGRATGISTEAARRKLVTIGAVTRHGRVLVTSRSLLRRAFPDDWAEIVAALTIDE